MKIDCNCTTEGHCSYYGRELWGRQWRVSHGLEGSEAEHHHYHRMLMPSSEIAPTPASEITSPQVDQIQTPVPAAKPAAKKPCCGRTGKPTRTPEQIQEMRDRWAKNYQ